VVRYERRVSRCQLTEIILTWQGWATDQQVWPLVGSGALHSAAVNHHDEFLNEGSPIASFLLSGFCFRAGPFLNNKQITLFELSATREIVSDFYYFSLYMDLYYQVETNNARFDLKSKPKEGAE